MASDRFTVTRTRLVEFRSPCTAHHPNRLWNRRCSFRSSCRVVDVPVAQLFKFYQKLGVVGWHCQSRYDMWRSKLGLTVDARCNGPAVRRGGNAPCPAEAGDHELTWLALSVIPVAWISVVGIIQHSQRNLTIQGGDCKDPKGEAEMVWRLLFSIELDAAVSWWWNIDVDSCDVQNS